MYKCPGVEPGHLFHPSWENVQVQIQTHPFDNYPGRGRERFGVMCNGKCRTTYGKIFIEKTGEHACVYCGMDLWNWHERWKFMTLDHVVPQAAWEDKGIIILPQFCHDYTNAVLSCSVCNSFDNQFWRSRAREYASGIFQ